ncbi:hypothetical protein GDO78_021384 [Eleutherodactylus coqui]|uniref:Uncharacterized protein n=1 Tax=Eleutherodactylus coqui TaxID=57060 RepID=A0A8J6E7B5_ELECQ|nr:hypothetical protein GDO78_021384 [Eleutherodactylus coqui]
MITYVGVSYGHMRVMSSRSSGNALGEWKGSLRRRVSEGLSVSPCWMSISVLPLCAGLLAAPVSSKFAALKTMLSERSTKPWSAIFATAPLCCAMQPLSTGQKRSQLMHDYRRGRWRPYNGRSDHDYTLRSRGVACRSCGGGEDASFTTSRITDAV